MTPRRSSSNCGRRSFESRRQLRQPESRSLICTVSWKRSSNDPHEDAVGRQL
jgi:hypothetical protein